MAQRSRPGSRRSRAKTARRAPARPPRPALGNDPFERGAAPRTPVRPPPAPRAQAGAVAPSPPPQAAPPLPAPPPPPPAAIPPAARLDRVERELEAALEGLEERLARVAERADLRGAELRQAAGRLLPRLRAGLSSAWDVLRLVEPARQLDRFGMDARFAERFAPLAELLYATWWRTAVRGMERVPAGPALVVANHAGLVPWDALVLRHALRRDHPEHRELRPLLDDRECALPLVGGLALRLGAVRASPEAAQALLAEGLLVGVFPEGSAGARKPWRARYRLQRFGRGGFVKLALRAQVPIVPCAILGSEEASPPISRAGWLAERLGVPLIGKGAALRFGPAALLPLPSRWSLRFDPPVPLDGLPPAAADDPAAVAALTERVQARLQAMLDEDVAARGTVFL